MKEKWIISSKNLVILLSIIGLFYFSYCCKEAPTTPTTPAIPELPSYGSIQVDSTPTRATIWLDNEDTGKKTPALLKNISVGSHTIKLTKEYYEDFETAVIVERNQTTIVNAELEQVTIPTLISPKEGAILDNGRTDKRDNIVWNFDWSDVIDATRYHLYVKGETATIPVINIEIRQSFYNIVWKGAYIIERNRFNWKWKVRALIGDRWGDWSEVRSFDVEPVNSDPPSN